MKNKLHEPPNSVRKKSGLFNHVDNIEVIAALHDHLEEVNPHLLAYIESTMLKRVAEVYTEFGFL